MLETSSTQNCAYPIKNVKSNVLFVFLSFTSLRIKGTLSSERIKETQFGKVIFIFQIKKNDC
jgi:hypothetical protein